MDTVETQETLATSAREPPGRQGRHGEETPESPALLAGAGPLAGFALLALVDAVAIVVALPRTTGGVPLRLLHLGFDLAETLGLGLLVGAIAAAWARFVRLPAKIDKAVVTALLFAAGSLLAYLVIGDYLWLQAVHGRAGQLAPLVYANFLFLIGGGFASGPAIAAYFRARPRWRLVPVALALAVMVADQVPLRDDYFGIHGLAAVGAVLLGGPALAAPLVAGARRLVGGVAGRVALGAAGVVALLGLVVPPGNEVRFELFRPPCTVAEWFLASTVWRSPALHAPVALAPSPWREDRASAPPIPPTRPSPLAPAPVVVLMTIDALRADVVNPATNDARYPTFARMKRDGITFTHATSAGTQTPVSISTLFSGAYFSEQRWEDYGTGGDRYPYPATDTFPRAPELLSAHGVATVNVAGFVFLAADFGVTRGFREQKLFGATKAAASGNVLVGAMLERLRSAGDGPLFLYSHLAEPHAPYWMGKGPTPFDHYLSAVGEADRQVARVLTFLEEHFKDRWALIVSADHGEAFGDHQTYEHAKTLYEELIHVPLLVLSPRFKARRVDQRVGLVDVGPTLLDLFQVDTPATFDGQSLVPLLAGGEVTFTRPLLAEGRLRTALTTPAGFKVIEDPRRKVVEAYDLTKDPRETRNVFDAEPSRSDEALAGLRAFFAARTRRQGGYTPPYKP